METTSPRDAALPDAERRQAFFTSGAALGFAASELARMFDQAGEAPRGPEPVGNLPLSHQEWQAIKGYIPLSVLSARGLDPRHTLDAMLYRVRNGTNRWRSLPGQFGDPDLLRQRVSRWISARLLADLFANLGDLDLSPARRAELEALAQQIWETERRIAERRAGRRQETNLA